MPSADEFRAWIEVDAAFDKRHPDSSKDYGVHSCDLRFYLLGELGAVQFVLDTGWVLPETIGMWDYNATKPKRTSMMIDYPKALHRHYSRHSHGPSPVDLGYHSRKPLFEGHEPMRVMQKRMEISEETKATMARGELLTVEEVTDGVKFPEYGDPIICPVIDDTCYYDGSSLAADGVFEVMLRRGSEGVWEELEKAYRATLEGAES